MSDNKTAFQKAYKQNCKTITEERRFTTPEPKPDTVTISRECEWALDDPDYTCYNSQCGQTFVLNDGDLDSNGFNFCYSCGGKIKENAMEVTE